MKTYNYKTLKSIREKQGLSQEQMAGRMSMTQSNYSKLENNHKKINSIEMLNRLAKALDITESELEAVLTQKKDEIKLDSDSKIALESLQQQIKIRGNFIENFIHSAFHDTSSQYEEATAWDEFGKHEIEYVVKCCGIKTKKEYDKLGYPLVTGVSEKNNQIAFEEMIDDINIYSCFEFGLVSDEHYLEMWNTYKKKDAPKFNFEFTKDGLHTSRN